MKQHFHCVWLHAAEEKFGAFTMKFLERNLERVQAGGINCRHGTHSKNHHARHTQGTGESRLELLRHAEEKRTFNPKYEHAFRHIFFTNRIAPPSSSSLSGVTSLICGISSIRLTKSAPAIAKPTPNAMVRSKVTVRPKVSSRTKKSLFGPRASSEKLSHSPMR